MWGGGGIASKKFFVVGKLTDFYGREISSSSSSCTVSVIPVHCPKRSVKICYHAYQQPWVTGPLDKSSPDCSKYVGTIVWNLNQSGQSEFKFWFQDHTGGQKILRNEKQKRMVTNHLEHGIRMSQSYVRSLNWRMAPCFPAGMGRAVPTEKVVHGSCEEGINVDLSFLGIYHRAGSSYKLPLI